MKIFMYSDLHISKTSSILPQNIKDSKYTYRQNMIIETGKYLANIIDQEKPDLIVNLGDTFDQHTITAYDVDIASEFFKCFKYINIPHIVLVGNHEMVNYDYNAIKILSNIDNITVISEPSTINSNSILSMYSKQDTTILEPNIELAFMPYMEYKDILSFPDGKFLFSHIDIMGMKIRGNYELPDGVNTEQLQKYDLVFNGHIHKPSIKNNIVNVGSITTHSFSDDNDAVPQCYIFDTETLNLKTFKPTICPLFRKLEVQTIAELDTKINELNTDYSYVLQISCPFMIKDDVKQFLENKVNIVTHKLNVKVNKETTENNNNLAIEANIDIKQSFIDFLDTTDLKYPKELYLNVLGGIK